SDISHSLQLLSTLFPYTTLFRSKNSLKKIAEAVSLRKELNANFLIEVDGGIDLKNAEDVLNAGCDAFVIGSSIFGTEDITSTTVKFKNIISGGKKIIS